MRDKSKVAHILFGAGDQVGGKSAFWVRGATKVRKLWLE